MTSRIRNRYPSLIRELDLETPPPMFVLGDVALPVVVLHEHCEGVMISATGTVAGAVGPVNILTMFADGLDGVLPFAAGAYSFTLFADWNIVVSAQEALSFRVRDSVGGLSQHLLWYFNIGRPAGGGRNSLVIPKVHVPEGSYVTARLETTLAAADDVTMGLVIQRV